MTNKQKALLECIEGQQPVVIYQLAKDVGRPYRRVYDNIQRFAEMGLVTLEQITINNRAAVKVVSTNPYYQGLLKLDSLRAAEANLTESKSAVDRSISSVIRQLSSLLSSKGAIVGSTAASLFGIERWANTVELAVDLTVRRVMDLLSRAGIKVTLDENDGSETNWKISGAIDGVGFQLVAAGAVGATVGDAIEAIGLRIVSEKDFITGMCMVGEDQNLHDAAVVALRNRSLKWFAMQQADRLDCREGLDAWLSSEQLLKEITAS